MSYFSKNTNITDASSAPDISWINAITGNTAAGKLTLQVIPGWTDHVIQTSSLTVQGNLAVTFAGFSGSTITDTETTTVAFSMTGG